MPRNSMTGQLGRRLAIIQTLPRLSARSPERGMTVEQVMTRLQSQFNVDRRTFERDLQSMAREVRVVQPPSLRAEIQQFLRDSIAFQAADA